MSVRLHIYRLWAEGSELFATRVIVLSHPLYEVESCGVNVRAEKTEYNREGLNGHPTNEEKRN